MTNKYATRKYVPANRRAVASATPEAPASVPATTERKTAITETAAAMIAQFSAIAVNDPARAAAALEYAKRARPAIVRDATPEEAEALAVMLDRPVDKPIPGGPVEQLLAASFSHAAASTLDGTLGTPGNIRPGPCDDPNCPTCSATDKVTPKPTTGAPAKVLPLDDDMASFLGFGTDTGSLEYDDDDDDDNDEA